MPNRILKESICTSDNIDGLSAFNETVFYRLIVNVDDYGRIDARPKILASRLFPLKDIRVNQIEDALRALTSAELVSTYTVDGKPFLQMNTWDRHQNVRAKKSKCPSPEEADHLQASASNCMQMNSDESKCPRNPNPNPNPNRKESVREKRERFSAPTIEEVESYCHENNYSIDAAHFIDYYTSNGWMVGKNHMKDWKAAVRTWVQKDKKQTKAPANRSFTPTEF